MSDIIEITNQDTLLVEEQIVSTLEVFDENTIAVFEEVVTLISEAQQGPQGIPGAQGIQGPSGAVAYDYPASTGGIGGHRAVLLDASVTVAYASNDTLTHANVVFGVSLNAASAGDSVTVVRSGEVTEPSWNWAPNLPVYLSMNGLLTQTPPAFPAASFSLVVGFPVTATKLFVGIRQPIILS